MLGRACIRYYISWASCRLQNRGTVSLCANATSTILTKLISSRSGSASRTAKFLTPHHQESRRNERDRSVRLLPAMLFLAATFKDRNEHNDIKDQNKDIKNLLQKAKRMSSEHSKQTLEQIYVEALHLALERKERRLIAHIQDELAGVALQTGDYKKAITLLQNVIKNLIGTGMKENDITILEISLKLATFYATSLKHDIAIKGYDWLIEQARGNLQEHEYLNDEKYEDNLAFLGMALDSYGRYLFMLRKTVQALEVTKEALDISTELFGENDIRTLVLLNDYGAILEDCNEFSEAENVIKKAIQNAVTCEYANHSDVAVFWVNLGCIYSKVGKSERATDAFKKAKKEALLSKNRSLQQQIEHYIMELSG